MLRNTVTIKTLNLTTLATAIGAALALGPAPVFALETSGIQEVVVTAQKREENLQTTPIAISAMSADTLTNLGITSFEGVAKASPSISFTPYPSSSNLFILFMRGQGVSDPMQITSDGSVGLYSDGFYISRPQASTFDLADIERVEVLRGPQGTLYGRNTTGGAVNLISRKPSGEFGFKQTLTFGTRNQFRSLTTVDLPKIGDVAAKITLLKSSKDGYVKNAGSGHDYGEEEQRAGRVLLSWQAADNVVVDYFLEKGNLDSTPAYYQNAGWSGRTISVGGVDYQYPGNADTPRSRTHRPIDLDLSTSNFEGHGLTVTWDVNDALTLKSLTGYRKLHWDARQDYADAFAFVVGVPPLALLPVSAASHDVVSDHQFSQELQFIGGFLGNQFKYVGGLYYFEESASHFERYSVSTFGLIKDRDVSADSTSKAVYAQLTWAPPLLDERLEITVGARYTADDRSADRTFVINGVSYENGKASGAANDDRFSRFNPALTFNYRWSDDISAYAKWVTGYKAGGSSESGPLFSFNQTFSPEQVATYEVGVKSYWWDRRIRLNTALFESKFDDMQLSFNVDPADSSVVQAYNAGKATVRGAEIELLVMPIDDLTLSVDYAYLDPKFDRVEALAGTAFDPAVNPASNYVAGQNIKNVFSMLYAPKHTVNLAADYTFLHFETATVAAHLDYHFQSHIFDTAPTGPEVPGREFYQIPSYGVFNGRITVAFDLPRGDRAKLALWGKNLTRKEYPVQTIGIGNSVATFSPQTGVTGAGFVQSATIWAEPPSYGVDLSYEY